MTTTYWDCLWIDGKCLKCYYFHLLVNQEKHPECPRSLNPSWRELKR